MITILVIYAVLQELLPFYFLLQDLRFLRTPCSFIQLKELNTPLCLAWSERSTFLDLGWKSTRKALQLNIPLGRSDLKVNASVKMCVFKQWGFEVVN